MHLPLHKLTTTDLLHKNKRAGHAPRACTRRSLASLNMHHLSKRMCLGFQCPLQTPPCTSPLSSASISELVRL